ncbi:hypothetical protein GCM10027360_76530 [Amycolatopsis echigonensis]
MLEAAQLGEGGVGVGQEGFAEIGQRDPAAGAVEKLAAQGFLEAADGVADGRLSAVQAFGGAAEVQFLRDRDERFQLDPVHRIRLAGSIGVTDRWVRENGVDDVRRSGWDRGASRGFPHDRKKFSHDSQCR